MGTINFYSEHMVQAAAPQHVSAPEGGESYFISVDGSEASELAFNIARAGLFRAGRDCYNVATITNSKKENLPFQYRPDFIEEKFQSKIYADAQSGSAKFIRKELEEGKTTKETLWDLSQLWGATVIVTGMHGRKGPKADLTVAGSAVQHLAQQNLPVAIIKDSNMTVVKDHYRFGVLFDGSANSEKVLQKTLSLMNDNDRLSIVTVVEENQMEHSRIQSTVAGICGERAYDAILLEREINQTIKARIKEYLKEQSENDMYIDFVCIGSRGLNVGNAADGDNFMGRRAQEMIAFGKLNVIFIPGNQWGTKFQS